ncbi:hypothetical protein CTEN210_11734 [Chaetoceros tenuissimus]|uniref:Uncharacterized protein n=1 Tax=Chaetoceros tenuissimus TaxID=426638 RepID=A0AAD3D073_9STRA|nr:hypothetical protein CTEN210_11734 [Chaetoceros tenuissimus]
MNLSFVLTFFLGQLLLAAPFAPPSGLDILNSRVTNRKNTKAARITQMKAVDDKYSDDDTEKAILHNLQRTCIKQFLSQRAFQSFMFLLADLRDVHTSDWLERFLDTPSLLQFHGTGAFNMTRFETWDSYFLELQKHPKEKIIVQARRSQAHGRRLFNSGSKNNPYLQNDFLTEIEIDIDPPSLVPRIIAVREQIAKELSVDADLIRIHSDQILQSYHDRVLDEEEFGVVKEGNFDRTASTLLANSIANLEFKPSPIRRGTFDLLELLSLHESIHRVLRAYKDEKQVEFDWLRNFFVERVERIFDGAGGYYRADDFVDELFDAGPSITGGDKLVDTLQIIKDILEMRSLVLVEWKEIVDATSSDHIDLKRSLLSQESKSWSDEEGISRVSTSTIDDNEVFGAFE